MGRVSVTDEGMLMQAGRKQGKADANCKSDSLPGSVHETIEPAVSKSGESPLLSRKSTQKHRTGVQLQMDAIRCARYWLLRASNETDAEKFAGHRACARRFAQMLERGEFK